MDQCFPAHMPYVNGALCVKLRRGQRGRLISAVASTLLCYISLFSGH